jgi:tetratricopeptide (TPR) repeat protein
VEKETFIKLLARYPESTAEEAQAVIMLKEAFPYSQVLHTLSARLSKEQGFSTQTQELQQAAVYAADRGVLKEVMQAEQLSVVKSTRLSAAISEAASVMTPAPVASQDDFDPDSVADEVMHDLEKLHELKQNFEALFIEGKANAVVPAEKEKPKPAKTETPLPVSFHRDLSKSKKERIVELAKALEEPPKTKKERIIELAKALEAQRQQPNPPAVEPRPPVKKKRDNPGEDIIEEIASTKETIEPENEKQKEQLEMIDQFIKTQPSISNAKDKPMNIASGDLSTIKTGEFSDNIVSETLVDILLKQGKKDKAIEVLKKLIWKFPQKKAYFAAQIEELKN